MFGHCLDVAKPALIDHLNSDHLILLDKVLHLLQRGCRLDSDLNSKNVLEIMDPLTLANEAELRLRGLIILTKLTDDGLIRVGCISIDFFSYLFINIDSV